MTSARELALRYDQSVAAHWRGDDADATSFQAWLQPLWSSECDPPPRSRPDAISVLGGAGAGIYWYETGSAVLGYVPGRDGRCLRVPLDATPPVAALVGVAAFVDALGTEAIAR